MDDENTFPAVFTRFTDSLQMRQILCGQPFALFLRPFTVKECVRLYTHYKTYLKASSREKDTLSVCYRMNGIDEDGNAEHRMLYSKVYLHGHSRDAYATLCTAGMATARNQAFYVPELDAITWLFPNDPQLPQLLELTDVRRVVQHLPYQALAIAGPHELSHVEVEVVHYRPETRCTLRYVLHFNKDGRQQRFTVFGKTFADDLGGEVLQRMWHCWSLAPELALRVAQPLGYSPAVRTVWQQGVDGRSPLVTVSAKNNSTPYAAIGRSLAALHQSTYSVSDVICSSARLHDARKKVRKLSRAFPELTTSLESVLHQCTNEYETLPPTRRTLLHGDLHPRQFLIVDEQVVMFDFDEFTSGDPAQDLANFLVDLCLDCPNGEVRSRLAHAFLSAYQTQVSWAVSEARIAWHARIQLLNKAYRFYLQQEPDLREKLHAVLTLATAPGRDFLTHAESSLC